MEPATTEGRPRWRREMLDEKAPELAAVFERHGVIAAYVFGSLSKGRDPHRVTARSDLDLALLFPDDWTPQERFSAAGHVESELGGLFGRGDLDLVVANDGPIVLRQQIVRDRDLIHGAHRPERVAFDWATSRQYLDTQPLRRFRYAAMLRRARAKGCSALDDDLPLRLLNELEERVRFLQALAPVTVERLAEDDLAGPA